MPDYQNGKIYSIRSHQTDKIYIGSTTQPLAQRMAIHIYSYKTGNNLCSSKEILQYEDAYIELIEDYPCDTKEQLNRREGEVIRNTTNCTNKCIAGRTMTEYRQDNKEKLNESKKKWNEENKERVAEHNKKYNEKNKERRAQYYREYYEKRKAQGSASSSSWIST